MKTTCLRAVLGAAFIILLILPASALAANRVVWANYTGNSIGSASTAGGSGQSLLVGGSVVTPFGLAVDPALGKVYWGEYANPGAIWSANLDGSGGATLVTDQEVKFPRGLTVDPTTHTIYWANDTGDSIRRVEANGSGNTLVYNEAGLTPHMNDPQGPVVDPAHNRLYWTNFLAGTVGYANLDGSGEPGTISFSGGCTVPTTGYSLAFDPAADRLWFSGAVSGAPVTVQAKLDGSGCSNVAGSTGLNRAVYGLAVDPDSGRLLAGFPNASDGSGIQHWPLEDLSAAPSVLDVTGASAVYAIYPAVVATPAGTATLTPTTGQTGTTLTCAANWTAGSPSMMLFRAPASTTSYSWSHDGQTITGATSATLTAEGPGSYRCTVSASNFAGSGSATSTPATVSNPDNGGGGGGGGGGGTPATETTFNLATKAIKQVKRKAKVKLPVTTTNSGTIAATTVTTCVKLGKGFTVAKQSGVVTSKGKACWTTATLAPSASVKKTLRLRAPKKRGTVSFTISAEAANAITATTSFKTKVK